MTTYDKFQAFQFVKKIPFSFYPSRYEVWQGKGQMTSSGKTKMVILSEVIPTSDSDIVRMTIKDPKLHHELANVCEFDEAVTLADRIQYITVPDQIDVNCVGLVALKTSFGSTRPTKNFRNNEPYCCNMFFENGTLVKLTFSFSNPAKLVEFYSDPNDFPLDFVFDSFDHVRYQNGVQVSGPHGEAKRILQIEPNIEGNEGYTVTIYNPEGQHPIWRDNVQMAPKQMKLIAIDSEKIALRGYGYDSMGAPFSDYGLTLNLKEGLVHSCTLHLHDRGVDIEYLL